MKCFVIFAFLVALTLAQDQCSIPDNEKIDCLPKVGGDLKSLCEARHCCYLPPEANMGVPYCYFPKNYGYAMTSLEETESGATATIQKKEETVVPYPEPVDNVKMEAFYETKTRVHIKLTDATKERFEVPIKLPKGEETPKETDYKVEYQKDMFAFKIRSSTGEAIFDTTIGGFLYSDQFLQIATRLPTKHIFGLSEHSRVPIEVDSNWNTVTIWPRDSNCPPGYGNLYGHHPFYMAVDQKGQYFGVLLYNSNAMDVILQPAPALTFRTIGGILDLYFFMGPTPEDVIVQYTDLVGKPFLPPEWGLGFQLCKYNYGTLDRIKAVHERMAKYNIPYDVQWSDIDAFDGGRIFTYNKETFKGFPEFVDMLHKENKKYLLYIAVDPPRYISIIDPALPDDYFASELAHKYDTILRYPNGTIFLVNQWAGSHEFIIDFTHPNATAWLKESLQEYRKTLPVDAAWTDMNELAVWHIVDCNNDHYNWPPYMPSVKNDNINDFTACMDVLANKEMMYNMHSVYAHYEAQAMLKSFQEILGERSYDISRASFVGQGKYGGHWGGDNQSDWENMKSSILLVTMFNMYGMPFTGVDICGFQQKTTAELCTRWTQLGAFYPFSRNHNADDVEQDPGAFGDEVAVRMRDAINIRYKFMPYLYSLMFKSHITGTPVARTLFMSFPEDQNTFYVDDQMMWDTSLLINPVLQPNVTSIHSYFPAGTWYNYYTNEHFESQGEYRDDPVTLDFMPLYVYGGSILVSQEPKLNVPETRKTNMTINVYMDKDFVAKGEFYYDDGITLDTYENKQYTHVLMEHSKQKFSVTVDVDNYKDIPPVNEVRFYGFATKPSFVFLNQKPIKPDFEDGVVIFRDINCNFFDGITIQWRY